MAGLLGELDSKQLQKTKQLEYFLDQLVQAPRDRVGLYEALLLVQCLEEGKLAFTSEKLVGHITHFFRWFTVYIETFLQSQSNYLSELSTLETLYLPFLPALTRTLVGCPRFTTQPHFRAALKNLAENAHPFMKQLILYLLQQIKIHDREGLHLALKLYIALDNITELSSFNDESSIIRYLLERINYARKEKLTTPLKWIDQILLSIHPKYESFTRTLIDFLNHQLFSFREEIIRIICIIRPVSENVQEVLTKTAKFSDKMLIQVAIEALQLTGDEQEKRPLSANASLLRNNLTALDQLKTKFPQLSKENLIAFKQVKKKTYSDTLVLQWIDWQLTRDNHQILTMIQDELNCLKVEEIKRLVKKSMKACSETVGSQVEKNNFLASLSTYHRRVLRYLLDDINFRDKFITFFLSQLGLKENILSSQKIMILRNTLLDARYQPFEHMQQRKGDPREVRLIVVGGGGGPGKTALTVRFIQGHFADKSDPTIEDSYRKLIEVDGCDCMLDVMDTSGPEEYSAIRDQHIKVGQVFILCYSITTFTSFEAAMRLRTQIIRIKEEQNVPIILVGCKLDREEERVVSTEQGRALAVKFGMSFFECSAKTNTNVTEIFHKAVRRCRDFRGFYQTDFYPIFLETFLVGILRKGLKIETLKSKELWVVRIIDTWLKMNKPMEFIFDLLSQYSQKKKAFAIFVFEEIKNKQDYDLLNDWLSVQLANPRKIKASLMNELVSFFTIENLPESTFAMLFELVRRDGNYQAYHQVFEEALSSPTTSFYQVYAVRFFIATGQIEHYEETLIKIIIRGLINQGGNIRFAILQLLNQWCPLNSDLIQTLAVLNTDRNLECRRVSMKLLAGLVNKYSHQLAFQALVGCLRIEPTPSHSGNSREEIPSWYEDNKAIIDALNTIEIKTLISSIQYLPAEQLIQYASYLRLILWGKQIAFVFQNDHLRFFDENHQEVALPAKEFNQVLLILQPDNKSSSSVECLSKKGKEELILEVDGDSLNEQSAASQITTQTGIIDLQAYSPAQLLSRSLPFVASSSSSSINSQDEAASQTSQQMLTANQQIGW